MSITAQYTIMKAWKQTKCPSTDNGLKIVCVYMSWNISQPLKKTEILPFSATWMDVENMLNELSLTNTV